MIEKAFKNRAVFVLHLFTNAKPFCSCTNLVGPEMFLDTIHLAAKDARRKLRQVTFQAQASDHPIIWGIENTNYLKFLIVQVL